MFEGGDFIIMTNSWYTWPHNEAPKCPSSLHVNRLYVWPVQNVARLYLNWQLTDMIHKLSLPGNWICHSRLRKEYDNLVISMTWIRLHEIEPSTVNFTFTVVGDNFSWLLFDSVINECQFYCRLIKCSSPQWWTSWTRLWTFMFPQFDTRLHLAQCVKFVPTQTKWSMKLKRNIFSMEIHKQTATHSKHLLQKKFSFLYPVISSWIRYSKVSTFPHWVLDL